VCHDGLDEALMCANLDFQIANLQLSVNSKIPEFPDCEIPQLPDSRIHGCSCATSFRCQNIQMLNSWMFMCHQLQMPTSSDVHEYIRTHIPQHDSQQPV